MKKTLLLLALIPTVLMAGEKDRIRLKDGSIYQGTVTTYQQNGPVIIELKDGQQITVQQAEIAAIKLDVENRSKPTVDHGFYNQISLGLLAGSNQYGRAASISTKVINGYQISPHLEAGLGVGLEPLEINTMPLFGQFKANFIDGPSTPFVDMRWGWLLPLTQSEQDFDPVYYGGPLFQFTLGGQFHTSSNMSVYAEAGYRIQSFRYQTQQQNWWENTPGTVITTNYDMRRIDVSFGVRFN